MLPSSCLEVLYLMAVEVSSHRYDTVQTAVLGYSVFKIKQSHHISAIVPMSLGDSCVLQIPEICLVLLDF